MWRQYVWHSGWVAVLLVSCAAEPAAVTRPVQVRCPTERVDPPVWALDLVGPAADIYTKGKAALAEIEQRLRYEQQLEAGRSLHMPTPGEKRFRKAWGHLLLSHYRRRSGMGPD